MEIHTFLQGMVITKLIIRPQNNTEDILHILTLNKEEEVTCSNNKNKSFLEKFRPDPTYFYIKQKRGGGKKPACRAT